MTELQKEADRRNIELLTADEPLTKWWVVRAGELQQVPMDLEHMTQVEAQHAHKLMDTYADRSERRLQAHARFMELLEPYFVDDNTTVEEACKRAGLTFAEAWVLAQAEGLKQ